MVTAFSDGTNVLPPAETCTVHLRQYRRNRSKSLLSTFARAALRTKIRPDEAESEDGGGSTVEDDNEA